LFDLFQLFSFYLFIIAKSDCIEGPKICEKNAPQAKLVNKNLPKESLLY